MARGDPVSQRPSERICQRRRRNEQAYTQTKLVPKIEKREQVWDPRPEARFDHAEEEAADHHASPVRSRGLQGRYEAPCEHTEGAPDVGRDELPHHGLELDLVN